MKLSVILSTVPTKHPLRAIRSCCDEVLEKLSPEIGQLPTAGRNGDLPSPKPVLRAQLLRLIYSIRTERQLLDQLDFNVLFRWFVGLPMEMDVWDLAAYAEVSARLIESGTAVSFFDAVIRQPRISRLLSGDFFAVDRAVIDGLIKPPCDAGQQPPARMFIGIATAANAVMHG